MRVQTIKKLNIFKIKYILNFLKEMSKGNFYPFLFKFYGFEIILFKDESSFLGIHKLKTPHAHTHCNTV